MPRKTCRVCHGAFYAVNNAKTCSPDCSARLRAERIKSIPKVKRPPKMKACVVCGVLFRAFSGTVLTCGAKCSKVRERQTTNNRQRQKRGTASRKQCVICEKMFPVYGTKKTCSEQCSVELTRQTNRKRARTCARETYKKWISMPENRERVRKSQREYKIRRLAKLSADERYAMEERAKSRELDRMRRERRKADAELMRRHREQVRDSQARRNKQRSEMTPDELAEARRKDREEMRRYAADPIRRARMNKLKRDSVRRRNAEAFTGTVMKALVVLTKLDEENRHE